MEAGTPSVSEMISSVLEEMAVMPRLPNELLFEIFRYHLISLPPLDLHYIGEFNAVLRQLTVSKAVWDEGKKLLFRYVRFHTYISTRMIMPQKLPTPHMLSYLQHLDIFVQGKVELMEAWHIADLHDYFERMVKCSSSLRSVRLRLRAEESRYAESTPIWILERRNLTASLSLVIYVFRRAVPEHIEKTIILENRSTRWDVLVEEDQDSSLGRRMLDENVEKDLSDVEVINRAWDSLRVRFQLADRGPFPEGHRNWAGVLQSMLHAREHNLYRLTGP